MRACYPAGLLLLGLWAWGCSGCEDVDGGYKPPSHQGFDEVDRYGAVRVGYLEDPNLGFDFNGKYIVYTSRKGRMYLVDVETEREVRIFPQTFIAPEDDYPWRSSPTISGNIVVCRGDNAKGEPVALWLMTLPTGEQIRIDLPYDRPDYMDLDGSKLVFNDQRYWNEGQSNVEAFLYDLTTGIEKRLTNQTMGQFLGGISGDHVVWEDYSLGHFKENVVLYTISTVSEQYLTGENTRQFAPAIHEDVVVWTDLRNGQVYPGGGYDNADIYMHRISTGELTQVTSEEHDQEYPAVYGKYISWIDLRFGTKSQSGIPDTTNVFVYNIETGEEKQVTFGRGYHEGSSKIWGDKLVYYSFATGGWGSLWMVDLKKYWPD